MRRNLRRFLFPIAVLAVVLPMESEPFLPPGGAGYVLSGEKREGRSGGDGSADGNGASPGSAILGIGDMQEEPPGSSGVFIGERGVEEGELEISYRDYIEPRVCVVSYWLVKPDGERIRIQLRRPPASPLTSGMKIRLTGHRIGDQLKVDPDEPGSFVPVPARESAIPETTSPMGNQRIVALLVNFQDTPRPALTRAQAEDVVSNQMNAYYTENSYGRLTIAGRAFGWYDIAIPRNCADHPFGVLNEAVRVADPDVYFPDYDHVLVIAPFGPNPCWAGNAGGRTVISTAEGSVSVSVAWINSSYAWLPVMAHEFGHNLGLGHSSFLQCLALSGLCSSIEGDLYDIMSGNIFWTGHMGAANKERLGWFAPSNIREVTSSGAYALEPLETASSGLKALKIRTGVSGYIYLEYRQPIGFDAPATQVFSGSNVFSGALMHVGDSLFDASPPPPASAITAALEPGQSLTDPTTAAVITVSSATPSTLTVNVALGKTDFDPPIVSITEPQSDTSISGVVTVTAEASDAAGIDRVEFFRSGDFSPFAVDLNPPYTVAWDTSRVPNGATSIYVKAYDRSGERWGVPGNEGISPAVPVTVANIDTNPPTVTLQAPVGAPILTNPVTVSVLAQDDRGVHRVEFWKDSDTWPFMTLNQAPYSAPGWFWPSGPHVVVVKVFDYVGNLATATASFTVDLMPPVVALTAPSSGKTIRASTTVSASASDDVRVEGVQFQLDGANLGAEDRVAPYGITWNPTGAPEGIHRLAAVARDAVGNVTVSADVTVTVDKTPPTVAISSPTSSSSFVSTASPLTLQGTASDNFRVVGVTWSSDRGGSGTATGTTSWTAGSIPLQSGTNVLTIRAKDAAGGTGIDQLTVSYTPQPTFSAVADSYVRDGTYSSTNYGSAVELLIRLAATPYNREAYLKFDLSGSASGSVVSATLRLYGRLSDNTAANVPTAVYPAAGTTWSEGGITWSNRPVSGALPLSTVTVIDAIARWYEWDVTSYLAAEKAAGRNVVSLVVKSQATSANFLRFRSKEWGSNPPQLVLITTP